MKYPSRYIDVLFRLMAVIPYLHVVWLYFNSQYRYHSLYSYISNTSPLGLYANSHIHAVVAAAATASAAAAFQYLLSLSCASYDCESSDLLTNLLNKIITHSMYVHDAKSTECNVLCMGACVGAPVYVLASEISHRTFSN